MLWVNVESIYKDSNSIFIAVCAIEAPTRRDAWRILKQKLFNIPGIRFDDYEKEYNAPHTGLHPKIRGKIESEPLIIIKE